MLKKSLITFQNGLCPVSNTIIGNGYRISILTDSLFRIEVGDTTAFCDMPTQSVWFRDLGAVKYDTQKIGKNLIITTSSVKLFFNTNTKKAITVEFLSENRKTKIENKGNLKGTCRTLDRTFGAVKLDNGLLSTKGVATFNDSHSLIINSNGNIIPREIQESDIYIFAYGYRYRECIIDLYKLTGKVPLVPRFALGVWWSRYRAYTQLEYLQLMQRFIDQEIPLTVATVDMDWHWTDCNSQFGTDYIKLPFIDNPTCGGWTGYSWNSNLFPNYRDFLKWLQERNLKVTLNLHPHSGIRWFEDMYEKMATAMGIDPASKTPVAFDVSKDDFWNNYFDIVHKPYEKDGVDFWWIDWQQGKKSQIKGLDPLWALNHYHFLDNAESGQMPLILSRYAGIGSHRYPLGFSGDTAQNWKCLNFQPYFTANASNVGYTWWSHDIGGHHMGRRDDQLYLRWLQFGVFSPIMRLHSTSHDLIAKEPWLYKGEIAQLAKQWLQLRHHLIPYLFTMDYHTHKDGIALIEPMYYSYPTDKNAYEVKNQYTFGSELIVAPITEKASKRSGLAKCKMWIPNGRYTDIFTKKIYTDSGIIDVYRDLSSIPVLLKSGGILPMTVANDNNIENPTALTLLASRGQGSFELYEDNGKTDFADNHATTKFEISENQNQLQFVINPALGTISVMSTARTYTLEIIDILNVMGYTVSVNDKIVEKKIVDVSNVESKSTIDQTKLSLKHFVLQLPPIKSSDKVVISITDYETLANPTPKDGIIDILSRWQANNGIKKRIYKPIKKVTDAKKLKRHLVYHPDLPKSVRGAIKEVFKR